MMRKILTALLLLAAISAVRAQFIGEYVWKSVTVPAPPVAQGECVILPGFVQPCGDDPPLIYIGDV